MDTEEIVIDSSQWDGNAGKSVHCGYCIQASIRPDKHTLLTSVDSFKANTHPRTPSVANIGCELQSVVLQHKATNISALLVMASY